MCKMVSFKFNSSIDINKIGGEDIELESLENIQNKSNDMSEVVDSFSHNLNNIYEDVSDKISKVIKGMQDAERYAELVNEIAKAQQCENTNFSKLVDNIRDNIGELAKLKEDIDDMNPTVKRDINDLDSISDDIKSIVDELMKTCSEESLDKQAKGVLSEMFKFYATVLTKVNFNLDYSKIPKGIKNNITDKCLAGYLNLLSDNTSYMLENILKLMPEGSLLNSNISLSDLINSDIRDKANSLVAINTVLAETDSLNFKECTPGDFKIIIDFLKNINNKLLCTMLVIKVTSKVNDLDLLLLNTIQILFYLKLYASMDVFDEIFRYCFHNTVYCIYSLYYMLCTD